MPRSDTTDTDLPQGRDAYQRLLADIRTGVLMPGDRLVEAELAERLGLSRTPIREAIRQLETEGLVTHIPRQGASIRQLNHVEVSELYDVRAMLEGTAARFAARAASDVELSELQSIHDELEQATDGNHHNHLNRLFHTTLYDAARNRFLLRSLDGINDTLLILGPTTLADDERAQQAVQEHALVLAALLARDQDAAEAHMRQHIQAGHRARLKQIRMAKVSSHS